MKSENEKQIQELSDLWHAMMDASKYKQLEDSFKRLKELTTIEIGILKIVSQNEDIILKEICTMLDIPKSTLTNAIDRLEKRDYIKRVISNRDRRSYGLELTDEGKLAQKEHIDFEYVVYGRIINSLDTYEEREELLKLLKKIIFNCNRKDAFDI